MATSDSDNPSALFGDLETEEITQVPVQQARFPGVVSFYRSRKQSEYKYGNEESLANPPEFGFDTYIPKLYGSDPTVTDTYKKSGDIITAFNQGRPSGSVSIHVYPSDDEMEKGTSRGVVAGEEKNYYTPWLLPTQPSMTLHLRIAYPKNKLVSTDPYPAYKDSLTGTDKTTEKIKFKIVKANLTREGNWNLIQNAQTQNYYILNENSPANAATNTPAMIADNSLSVTKEIDFDISNESLQSDLIITLTGNNPPAALIAYYERTVGGNTREHVIGQVNILPREYHKYVSGYDPNASAIFTPFPYHYVKVKIDRVTLTNNGINKTAGGWASPLTRTDMTDSVNKYLEQAGIQVENRSDFSEIEVSLINGTILNVNGKEFPVKTENGYNFVTTEITPIPGTTFYLKTELKEVLKKQIINKHLYYERMPLGGDVRRPPIGGIKTLVKTTRYNRFLQLFPDLINRNIPHNNPAPLVNNTNAFWTAVDDQEYDRAVAIADYFVNNIYMSFLINDIWGGDGDYTNGSTAAYGTVGGNEIVVFGNLLVDITSWKDTMPHEFGHSFGLQHSFYLALYRLFPQQVFFESNNSKWTTVLGVNDANDHKGYAATYDNIMDYKSRKVKVNNVEYDIQNPKFKRQTFTKKQWETMHSSINRRRGNVKNGSTCILLRNNNSYYQNNMFPNDFIEELNNLLL